MNMNKRYLMAAFILFDLIVMAAVGSYFLFGRHSGSGAATIPFAEFRRHLEAGDFKSVVVREERGGTFAIAGEMKGPAGGTETTRVPTTAVDGAGWTELQTLAAKHGATLEFQPRSKWRP
jgi:hypothetical protein